MSTNSRVLACSPQDVFDILTDGWSYATWVVGAARIRDVDEEWPDPGSRIHHSVGMWPFLISDNTEIEEIDAPHEVVLRVRAWPAGEGRVRITCAPRGAGETEVVIEEYAVSGPAKLVPHAVQSSMLKFRNAEALRRLAYLAESRARAGQNDDGRGSVARTREQGQ
jgi:uncharacterized protein YndB with AHSA1/START domain